MNNAEKTKLWESLQPGDVVYITTNPGKYYNTSCSWSWAFDVLMGQPVVIRKIDHCCDTFRIEENFGKFRRQWIDFDATYREMHADNTLIDLSIDELI